jgi:hypothetical protein
MIVRQRAQGCIAAIACVLVMSACAQPSTPTVNPMRTPSKVDDVTGIWRAGGQTTLELRKNGTYVLITPVSDALAGDYSLSGERVTVFGESKACGKAQGTYRIQVSYQQRLLLTDPNDECALRRSQLTADPFVYGG